MGPQLFCFSDGVNLLEFIKFVFLLLCNVFFLIFLEGLVGMSWS